jgi:hypothetical protein
LDTLSNNIYSDAALNWNIDQFLQKPPELFSPTFTSAGVLPCGRLAYTPSLLNTREGFAGALFTHIQQLLGST